MNQVLEVDLGRLTPERPPVMLLGGMNLVRSLGLAGIPAIVASPEPWTPAMASRYCIGRCALPPLSSPEAVAARLLQAGDILAERLGVRVPLFYGDDDYLGIVQQCVTALSRRYLLLLNDPRTARALHSKPRFQALAERRGLPIPRRLDWEALERFDAPVLAKPKMKTAWHDSQIHRRLFGGAGKARIFSSGQAARTNTLVQRLADALQFQEYVPGDDRSLWSFHGFADEQSQVLEWFTGRKIRTNPPLTGDSSYLELAHDDALVAHGREVVSRLRLRGIFKIDFKRHAETGRFYVLEVNARFNLWQYLGAANGVNLAEVAYDYLTRGARPVHKPARSDYRWLCLRLDYKAYRRLAAEGRLSLPGWIGSLLAARKVYDLFSWRDPLPFLLHLRQRARALPRFTRRVLGWRSTA